MLAQNGVHDGVHDVIEDDQDKGEGRHEDEDTNDGNGRDPQGAQDPEDRPVDDASDAERGEDGRHEAHDRDEIEGAFQRLHLESRLLCSFSRLGNQDCHLKSAGMLFLHLSIRLSSSD